MDSVSGLLLLINNPEVTSALVEHLKATNHDQVDLLFGEKTETSDDRIAIGRWPKSTTGVHLMITRTNHRTGKLEILFRKNTDPQEAPDWVLPRGAFNPAEDASLDATISRVAWEKAGVLLASERFAATTDAMLKQHGAANGLKAIISSSGQATPVSHRHYIETITARSGASSASRDSIVLDGHRIHLQTPVDTLADDKFQAPEIEDPNCRWVPIDEITMGFPPQGAKQDGKIYTGTLFQSDSALIETAVIQQQDRLLAQTEAPFPLRTCDTYEAIAATLEKIYNLPEGSLLHDYLVGPQFESYQRYIIELEHIFQHALKVSPDNGNVIIALADGSIDNLGEYPSFREALEKWQHLINTRSIPPLATVPVRQPPSLPATYGLPPAALKYIEESLPADRQAELLQMPPAAAVEYIIEALQDEKTRQTFKAKLAELVPDQRDLLLPGMSKKAGDHIVIGHRPKSPVGVNMVITRYNEDGELELLLGYKEHKTGAKPKEFVTIGGHYENARHQSIDEAITAELYEETGIALASPRFAHHNAHKDLSNENLISRSHFLSKTGETVTRDTHKVIFYYWLHLNDGMKIQPEAADDVKGARWVKLSDIELTRPETDKTDIGFDNETIYLSDMQRAYRESIEACLRRINGRIIDKEPLPGVPHNLEFYETLAAKLAEEHNLPKGALLEESHMFGKQARTYVDRIKTIMSAFIADGVYLEQPLSDFIEDFAAGGYKAVPQPQADILRTNFEKCILEFRDKSWISPSLADTALITATVSPEQLHLG